ncbi:MAG TPA: hypothetical protein VIK53_03170 [Verrucomicrobiae bacterium]
MKQPLEFFRQHVAERDIALPFALVADAILFAEIFDGNDVVVRHEKQTLKC